MTETPRVLTDEELADAIRDGQACLESGRGYGWLFPPDLTLAALRELQAARIQQPSGRGGLRPFETYTDIARDTESMLRKLTDGEKRAFNNHIWFAQQVGAVEPCNVLFDLVRGIEEWNAAVDKIIARPPNYSWPALERAKALLASKNVTRGES